MSFIYGNGTLQSSQLQSTPTNEKSANSCNRTQPSLAFLAPTKKGLRSQILKCKILLASLMPISDCHQSAAQPFLPINLCLSICSSILLVNLCSSFFACQYAHQHYWSSAPVYITIIIKSISMYASSMHHHHQGLNLSSRYQDHQQGL